MRGQQIKLIQAVSNKLIQAVSNKLIQAVSNSEAHEYIPMLHYNASD